MVDCVLIDPAYGGHAVSAAQFDVSGKKEAWVSRVCELPIPEGATPVAVQVGAMFGEEVVVTVRPCGPRTANGDR
jgi:hypothetical protein